MELAPKVEAGQNEDMVILHILLALFLPPISAFFSVGFGKHFWINCLLTLLGGLPGSIHAVWLLSRR